MEFGKGCHDLEDFNMRRVFDKTYEIIKSVKERGERVLVHCQAGVSRSASVSTLHFDYNRTITLSHYNFSLCVFNARI
jgi:protein tyrosine phosphatase